MTAAQQMPDILDPRDSVRRLRGAGPRRAAILGTAGIVTVRDLLEHLPYRYEDRRAFTPIASLTSETPAALIKGRVAALRSRITKVQHVELIEAAIDDGSSMIDVVWFNQPYVADRIAKGDVLALYGRPRTSPSGAMQFDPADWEVVPEGGKSELEGTIVPVYTAIGGLPQKWLRGAIVEALAALPRIEDHVPSDLVFGLGLPDLGAALEAIHAPCDPDEQFMAGESPAHARLAFDEFFAFQLAVRARRAKMEL
jgi:ATP-dependent DNA helicase RecG